MRPLVSGGTRTEQELGMAGRNGSEHSGAAAADAPARATATRATATRQRRQRAGAGKRRPDAKTPGSLRVRKLARGADDGFHATIVAGLKSSEDAARLAVEIVFAAARLERLGTPQAGLWAEVAGAGDIEERTWLAFLIAYVGPLEDGDPWTSINAARLPWAAVEAGQTPAFAGVVPGSRGSLRPGDAATTLAAYRAWAARAGSQADAFTGESSWTPERRFERCFERLALGGLGRDTRFELLTGLGASGVYPLAAGRLELGGENEATWAAKRALGIGDPMLLERRAAELAETCEVPLGALDLALHNWGSGRRLGAGVDAALEPDADALARVRAALGL